MRKLFIRLIIMSFAISVIYGITAFSAFAIENAMFPMEYLNISQGANDGYSHAGRVAIDICGRDTGQDAFYAPFTGTIKKTYGTDHVVWLESNEPVRFADGTVDYMTIMCMHDNDISDLYVGKVIRQGEHFLTEGTAGNATGNHIHIECGRGQFTGSGWYQNSYGKWCINNGVMPYDALFLSSSTKVINGYGYNWRYVNNTPLTAPVMTSSKSTYAYGSTVTLSWNAISGASGYSLYIWGVNRGGTVGNLSGIGDNGVVTSGGTSWSGVLPPDSYVVYVSAFNSSEWKTSSGVKFTVSDSIDTPVISSSKSIYAYGERVTLSWNKISGASGYSMYFWSDKKGEIGGLPGIGDNGTVTSGGTSWSGVLEPGNYKVYVSAFNAKEWKTSSAVKFTVEEQVKVLATSTTATRTNGAIEVQTTISNLTESASCVEAVYSADGTLLGQSSTDVDSRTNSTTAYFPNYPSASYVKVFLWDSLKGMKPLTNGEKIDL